MIRSAVAALAAASLLALASSPATAEQARGSVTQFCGDRVCAFTVPARAHFERRRNMTRVAYSRRGARRATASPGSRRAARTVHRTSASLAAVIGPLAAKAQEIVAACGSRVVSAHRPGARIAGSGHYSLHAQYPAKAVDLAGNPACIYARLKGWQGGYSIDYRAVAHVHVSYDPNGHREWGARFAHRGGYQPTQQARRIEAFGSVW